MKQNNNEYYNVQRQYEKLVRVTVKRLKTLINDLNLVSDTRCKSWIEVEIEMERTKLVKLLDMADNEE